LGHPNLWPPVGTGIIESIVLLFAWKDPWYHVISLGQAFFFLSHSNEVKLANQDSGQSRLERRRRERPCRLSLQGLNRLEGPRVRELALSPGGPQI
jgi:hypothetical protein